MKTSRPPPPGADDAAVLAPAAAPAASGEAGMSGADRVRPAGREMPAGPPAHATRGQRIALLVGLVVAAWLVLQLFASILLPFVAAAGIAYVLDPFCTRLTRAGVPRGPAALLLVAGVIVAGLLFVLLLYPVIVNQLGILLGRVPDYARALRHFAGIVLARLQDRLGTHYLNDRLQDLVSAQAGVMLSFIAGALARIVGSGFALFNVLSLVLVTPVVAFYLLRDWPRAIARVDSWLPRRYAPVIRAQAREVNRILSAWVRGQAICCVLLALFYAVALSLVGLDLGLIVGISAGLLSFIPYVGTITGGVTSIGLAFAQFPSWAGVLRVIAVFILGQFLEGYVIYPRFLGDRVELHAVWVIFALFAGGAAFGFLGVMLAVPVAAMAGVLARFWLHRYMESPLYTDPG